VNNPEKLKTGGDPRALPDFAILCAELAKLTHPARPDVDWTRVEQLSLSLFRQNGVELQTAVWYCLARTRLAGIAGLNEGLALLDALLTCQWGAMWPQADQARIKILAGFSQRLQTMLRTLTLHHSDLPQVCQAEQHLNAMRDLLQRMALAEASRTGELCAFMHKAVSRLEQESREADLRDEADVAAPLMAPAVLPAEPLVYVAREVPAAPERKGGWKLFAAGMLTMLTLGAAAEWGWQRLYPAASGPLPVTANEAALKQLAQLSPLWRQQYGFALAARAQPAATERLKVQWRQHITGNALPSEALTGWHQGMEGLQEMARQLNALDVRKGKYLTGSQLKTMVFAITQDFARSVPVEEQLYQISQAEKGKPIPEALLMQTDMHLNQLLNRYMLIRTNLEEGYLAAD
jgi:type VI secretion system protein VasL